MTALSLETHTQRPGRPGVSKRVAAKPATRHATASAAVPKLRYIVVTLLGIFAILAVQLMLSIAVSGGAYEIASLKGEMRSTEQQRQMVAEDINALVAPDTLAGLATSLGMVTDNNPAYLRLSDARVVGEAVPATAGSGGQVYPVTSGTETTAPPAIVGVVFESVTLAQSAEIPAEDVYAMTPAAQEVTSLEASAPAATTSPVAEPTVRFGGTIPSPTTR
jgi:hypothetical protein